ncbi:hypothetical protein ACQKO5_12655 [Novosphingobium subterraneum]|uniref:hypothetical protein n=1 Tax=Novosphingobium subterraneum TaxID=48936 RepID=UPI003D0732BF
MTKPSAFSPNNVSHAAERAAAYAVAVRLAGVGISNISIAFDDEPADVWMPWAWSCVCPASATQCGNCINANTPAWHERAILAAEVIAMQPEHTGDRWDAIDLEGLEVAKRLVDGIDDKRNPLYAVSAYVRADLPETPTASDLDEARSHALEIWEAAEAVVRSHRDQIDRLAIELRKFGELDGEALKQWFSDNQA